MSAPNSDSHRQNSHAGQVAVVTGAARGIGQALCNALAERGADVVGVDVGELHQTGKLVVDHGSRWLGVLLDITDVAAVARLATTVAEEFGGVDILVNKRRDRRPDRLGRTRSRPLADSARKRG